MKTIEIKEDFRLPGTDVILEAGDKIQIQEANNYRGMVKDAYRLGQRIGQELDRYLTDRDGVYDFVEFGKLATELEESFGSGIRS